MNGKKRKAIALISGGLDSTLAVYVVKNPGIDVMGIHFAHAFNADVRNPESADPAKKVAEQLGIPLETIEITDRIIAILKSPAYGFGKNLNPCVDCRIMQFRLAKEYMERKGADFIITGEVVGQRPMSQRRDAMEIIDAEAGVEGIVLRPLSALKMKMTIPEKNGWIDRSKLYGITGRSRKEQKILAKTAGILEYPESAGGCRLTYEDFSRKMRDLVEHKEPDKNDSYLLQVGRHFRTSKTGKAIVGKNVEENKLLKELAREGDILVEVHQGRGPTVLLRDGDSEKDIVLAACLCVSHAKLDKEPFLPVRYWRHGSNQQTSRQVAPLDKETIEKMRI